MADKISKKRRSWNMSRIKSGNTKPEILVRKALYKMGYRYRLHRKDLPGCPDIVLPRHKIVIFVHGCFWHRHPGCKYVYTPKSRVEFWTNKFSENVRRDQRNHADLKRLGWSVGVVWECETSDPETLARHLKKLMSHKHELGGN